MIDFMKKYAHRVVGPVMYQYTKWVLDEAQKRGIKRLYFLARDGYLLREIAEKICSAEKIDIECRYLYCSRSSLRMPSYRIIGDEMYDLLLLGGYYITPKTLLLRAGLNENELKALYSELEIEDENKCLSEQELNILRAKIKESKLFYQSVLKRSGEQYEAAIDYFKDEGLFDNDYVAVVDSGWTGSMQRSIRQLLESAGYNGKMIGFYFGMYVDPKDEADGEYLTYYFSKANGKKRKRRFNNNLFECMLSANHPMTLRYEKENGKSVPIFAEKYDNEMSELVNAQIEGALSFVDEACAREASEFDYKKSLKASYRLLKKAMIYPTREEANMYSAFTFCDDITEEYKLSLANKENIKYLKNYMLIPRIFRKLFKRKKTGEQELFWTHGVVAFCNPILRPWYRFNIFAWEWLKDILGK